MGKPISGPLGNTFLMNSLSEMTEEEIGKYVKERNRIEAERPKVYTITAKEMIDEYNEKLKSK